MAIHLLKKNKLITVTIILYLLTLIFSKGHFDQALRNTIHYLIEMMQVMPIIFMLTFLIEVWISRETIIKNLGNHSGLKGFGFSVVMGSLSAGPIYAAFPICKMLLSKGASVANIIVILSSWAVIKVPMLANEAKFLGPRFMITRWVLTIITIYIMGYVISTMVKKEDIPSSDTPTSRELFINENYCVGCGICAKILPQVYVMDRLKAHVKTTDIDSKDMPRIMNTIEKCPVKAIAYHRKEISA